MHDDSNDTTSGTADGKYLVDRREYLKATGTVAASVAAGATAAGTAAADDYETITVSSGEVRSFSLGDGDTLENVLIDITADNAGYSINANGDGWAIRNVGVRGYYDAGHTEPFIVQCPDGGSGVVENVYLGDGGGNGSTGVFAFPDHAGHVDIDNLNVQGWPDNGVYASAPGNHDSHTNPGGQGTFAVTNSYGADNGVSNFRLGTDGSYIENCVSVGGQRGYWGFYNETDVIDCDIDSGIYASDSNWSDCAVVTVDNTRFSGGTTTYTGCAAINGSSAGTPGTSPPSGVPTSAEEAASGSGGGGGGGGGSDDRLEIVAASDASDVSYTFDVYGSVSKVTDNGDNSSESNDEITDNGDGTYTVDGLTGNGYGDTFDFSGNVFSWSSSHAESAYTLYLNGTAVAPDELTTDRFEIVAGDGTSEMSYQFTVDGSVSKVTDNGDNSSESNDEIIDNGDGTYTVDGLTGNGYGDTYDFDGTRSDWSADYPDSAYTLYTNGSETDPGSIGGGDGGDTTVLDDFEDGDLSEYSGHTGEYQVQSSTVLEGSYTLEATDPYGELARADVTTERGYEYRCQIRAGDGSGAKPSLLACVGDDADPMQDAYWAFPNTATGEFKIMRRDGGSSTTLDSVSYALEEGVTYELALELGTDTVKAVLYDASGSVVAETDAVADATYSGGSVGLYTGGGSPAYYDHVTKTPL